MNMPKYILALDQGTTSSRAIIFDTNATIIGMAQQEFPQIFPQPGWVEHDPMDIWNSQLSVLKKAINQSKLEASEISCLGITNQRETTIIWDKSTGKPIHNAIVWQDNRTSKYCESLKSAGHSENIQNKTGLILNAYFSGTKVRYILRNVPGAMEKAKNGELAFGTVDSWLLWNLTDGKVHATDVTNASRTLLFNIHTTSTTITSLNIPISGIAGDQQAALFGQMCTEPGMIKNTYGTGCFMVVNTGEKAVQSKNNLLTTIGWKQGGKVTYALEGSVFIAGSVIQWLRDGIDIIDERVFLITKESI